MSKVALKGEWRWLEARRGAEGHGSELWALHVLESLLLVEPHNGCKCGRGGGLAAVFLPPEKQKVFGEGRKPVLGSCFLLAGRLVWSDAHVSILTGA